MALVKCPECGNEISDKAKSCPACGWSNSAVSARKKVNRWSVITIILAVFGILWSTSLDQGFLFNHGGAHDITVNGIPLAIILSIPPIMAILVSVFNMAVKNAKMPVRAAATIVGIAIIWGLFLLLNFTGMFINSSGAGTGMGIGSALVSITLVLALVASRKLSLFPADAKGEKA